VHFLLHVDQSAHSNAVAPNASTPSNPPKVHPARPSQCFAPHSNGEVADAIEGSLTSLPRQEAVLARRAVIHRSARASSCASDAALRHSAAHASLRFAAEAKRRHRRGGPAAVEEISACERERLRRRSATEQLPKSSCWEDGRHQGEAEEGSGPDREGGRRGTSWTAEREIRKDDGVLKRLPRRGQEMRSARSANTGGRRGRTHWGRAKRRERQVPIGKERSQQRRRNERIIAHGIRRTKEWAERRRQQDKLQQGGERGKCDLICKRTDIGGVNGVRWQHVVIKWRRGKRLQVSDVSKITRASVVGV
jgi:hypothetical protein